MLKSIDDLKDQSFFLAQIEPRLLPRILFPIGGERFSPFLKFFKIFICEISLKKNLDYTKSVVRKMAGELGLVKISKKKSSVGICFIGKRTDFPAFIGKYIGSSEQSGNLVDLESGKLLGTHSGIHTVTIGQRVPIQDQRFNKIKRAYFVAKKNPDSKTIYVVISI